MKNKFLRLFCFICLICTFSCEDIETINIDPDAAPAAPPQQVLSAAQAYLGWIVDSRLNGQSFLWGQYWTWGPGVSLGNAARYVAEPPDHNNYWFRSYANALTDLQELERSGNDAFAGVAKVLKAYVYQGLVDHFGDVPYSEAIKGAIEDGSNFNPAYDNAQTVYANLITDIDEGIALLNSGSGMGDEDMVFEGDLSQWIQFANSLKLRVLMRQSVTGDAGEIGAAVRAVIANGNFLESTQAQIEYTGDAGSENPMFADEESGIGLFYVMSDASYSLLSDLNDPRLFALYNPREDAGPSAAEAGDDDELAAPTDANGYRAVKQGGINDLGFGTVRTEFSQPSSTIYSATAPVVLMSDWEVWFLRAEAAARYNTGEDELTAFNNGVTASFNYLGVADPGAYLATLSYDSGADLNSKLRIIGTQKWIACNGTQEDEGWIESRRFDTPDNPMFTGNSGIFQSPPQSAIGGAFPSAWLYPGDEQSLNSNAPSQRVITDKVFWDN